MTYGQGFDRLGNQVKTRKSDWQHRLIQIASLITIVVSIFILVWVR